MSASSNDGFFSRTDILYWAGKQSTEKGVILVPAGVIGDRGAATVTLKSIFLHPFRPAILPVGR